MVEKYLGAIIQKYKTGKTTEHSFRGDLQDFVERTVTGIQAINEPRRQKCGAPDYIIQKKNIPIGYIEAKDIDKSLETIDKTEQLDRYRASLDNLILTNYLEFWFYSNGEHVDTIKVAELSNGKIKTYEKEYQRLINAIRNFCDYQGQTIKSPKHLANLMAQKAVMITSLIITAFEVDSESSLVSQRNAFKQILLHDLNNHTFADMYAQTIAYGLFVARLNDTTLEDFSRQEARELISKNNPFLRQLFDYISGANLDDSLVWIVDDLVEIFRAVDLNKLLKNYGRTTRMSDPFLHFYETFLESYDKVNKEKRGVYYTPQPVVRFIVSAVDNILKNEFNLSHGLADDSTIRQTRTLYYESKKVKGKTVEIPVTTEEDIYKVQILDPATGTGTFLAETIRKIYSYFVNQQGIWSQYVDKALIPRLNGFEIMMTPYVMCHLKLDLLLQDTGYKTTSQTNRFNVYLTNALEKDETTKYPLFDWLSEEAKQAGRIKSESPIMVVLGNPPYSVSSCNKSDYIDEIMEVYKQDLNEKNIQPLSDDYIKFIRMGETFIEKNNEGILAYISNNSFLDGLIHRRMRKHLMETFDKIYILDLHGNAKKKETAKDGSKDENVFDIQQGVSINIFVKTGKKYSTPSPFACGTPKEQGLGDGYFENSMQNVDCSPSPLAGETPKVQGWSEEYFENSMQNVDCSPSPLAGEGRGEGYVVSHQYYAPYIKELSREKRKEQTPQEYKIWQILRNNKTGYKFRRQFSINNKYIADFICLEKRLIIEIDGGQHNYSVKDIQRTFYLEKENFRIIRFWNNEVDNNIEGCYEIILEELNKPLISTLKTPHPNLAPLGSLPQGEREQDSVFVTNEGCMAQVYHAELFGLRENKFEYLNTHELDTVEYRELTPVEPYYFFVPKDFSLQDEYDKGFKIDELFIVNTSGVKTQRDDASITFTQNEADKLREDFLSLSIEELADKYGYKNVRDWNIALAKKDIENNPIICNKVLYRPFDVRCANYTGLTKGIMGYPRYNVMKHFIYGENIGLVLMRSLINTETYSTVFLSNFLTDINFYGFQSYNFPLYLYADNSEQKSFFEVNRKPNLNMDIVRILEQKLGLTFTSEQTSSSPLTGETPKVQGYGERYFGDSVHNVDCSPSPLVGEGAVAGEGFETFAPIDILDYIYGVLHSNKYRTKYKEFLKIDFPRIPYPGAAHADNFADGKQDAAINVKANADYFFKVAKLGRELREIHLMESDKLSEYITSYGVSGDNEVIKPEFRPQPSPLTGERAVAGEGEIPPNRTNAGEGSILGKVYINRTQYFDNVPEVAWNFYIGGYQPAQKWLKDRKGRILSYDEILHYQKIIKALVLTNDLMQQIDNIIEI